MIRLLNADFYKLKKCGAIWIAIFLSIIVAGYYLYQNYNIYKNCLDVVNVNNMIFKYLPIFCLVTSIFTSTFLGLDYQNGSIKNKIIVGHDRTKIYLSNLIITFIASLLVYLVFVFIICLGGYYIFEKLNINIDFLLNILIIIFIIFAYVSISNFIIMSINDDILSPILSIIISFVLIFMSFSLLSSLSELKYSHSNDEFYINELGQEIKDTENPNYVKGIKRKVYETLVNFLPTGQAFQLSREMKVNLYLFLIYSAGFIVVFNGMGIYIFKHKELK